MIIGKNFKTVLHEEVLTGIAKIINSLSADMSCYDDTLFDETLELFTDEMEKTIISYISSQVVSAKNIRNVI